MSDRLRPALGLALGLAAVLVSGCGSGGASTASVHAEGSASSPRPAPTKARFIAQAEAICRGLSAQERPLQARQASLKELPPASADKVFVSLVHQVIALSRAADRRLGALPRPSGDARAIQTLLSSFSEEATDAAGIAKAAVAQESTLGEDDEDVLKRSIARNSALADAYGMKDCNESE